MAEPRHGLHRRSGDLREQEEGQMSRSGYSEDYDDEWGLIRWRGAVASAIRGRRGQAFLKEMLGALDALPQPELGAHELAAEGAFCAIGAVGRSRGIDMSAIDPYDANAVAATFGIAPAMAREIVYENDGSYGAVESPATRFHRMKRWIAGQIVQS